MALTFGSLTYDLAGSRNVVRGTIAFDSSYPTGGESLTPANIGLSTITNIIVSPKSGYVFEYDATNQKLLAYRSAAQVFTGSALAAHAHDLLVKGSASGGIDEPLGVEGTDTLAKDAATDRTITGAASATKGGVITVSAGTPAGTNAAAAMTEVSNATNLSTLTGVNFEAVGF